MSILEELASMIQKAANDMTTGRYGERKVFISELWQHLGGSDWTSLETFKNHLTDANREGYMALHRADLVGAMDTETVAASETTYLNATFHFVESPLR